MKQQNLNKKVIRLTESELKKIVKESVKTVINEISYNTAKNAYYKAYDNISNNPNVTTNRRNQLNNLYNHLNDRKTENIDLSMPVIIVGGELEGKYTVNDIINNFEIKGYFEPFRNSTYKNSKIVGYPEIKNYLGPMWDGDRIRYESPEVYKMLST